MNVPVVTRTGRDTPATGQAADALAPSDVLGHVIEDRYRLVSVIGRGGFGTVYRASHERLPRDFAVKVLHAARASDPRQVTRFQEEVRAAARVQHPNVVEVIDFGHDPSVGYFIVMPLLQGQSLLERLGQDAVLPILDVHTVLSQSAAALAAAHKLGIVHCDIKSENVHLVNDLSPCGFRVCILDFGVARARPLPGELRPQEAPRVVGTALSMSPEQILRRDIDGRADIYGLGVVLYEMLTGTLPFVADDPSELMRMHVQDQPRRPSAHRLGQWIPDVLDDFVLSLLSKDREDRPASMAALIEQWERLRPVVQDAWASAHLAEPASKRASGILRPADLTLRLTPPTFTDWDAPPPQLTPRHQVALQARALVVDDDESLRDLMRLILQNAGWTCATVASGQAALEWMEGHQRPTVVVLDMLMPGMDGMNTLRAMRAQGYTGPVVVCSSVQSDVLRSQVEMGADDRYVTKGKELHTLPKVLADLGLTPG